MFPAISRDAPGFAKLPWQKIWFSRGSLLFWYKDLDGALRDFTRVTEQAKQLDLNTEVLAGLRLGQTYDLLGRRDDAVQAYERAIRTAPESDRAREAKAYMRSPYRRKNVG